MENTEGELLDGREYTEEKQHVRQDLVHVDTEGYGDEMSQEDQLHGNSELETELQPVAPETSIEGALVEVTETQAFILERGHGEFSENVYSEQELQQRLLLKEEEVSGVFEGKLAESEVKWAAQLQASRQDQASEFAAEFERLKLHHSEEVENLLKASREAEEELANLKANHTNEIEYKLAECEKAHMVELQVLRAEIEQLHAEKDLKEESGKEMWESLVPKLNSQVSPQLQKEMRLQKERLQRLHKCDIKAQEQKLRNEFSLASDMLQAKLEEEYTGKLAKVLTESALKNASQVEQISQQLRAEKQRALSQLEKDQAARHEQEVARLLEERREAMEACKRELEAARVEYQSKIAELETALATEQEKQMEAQTDQCQRDWVEKEAKLREEMEFEYRKRVEEVRAEHDREKEEALISQRQALEERLETELRAAHQMHEHALKQNQAQLQSLYDKELVAARDNIHTIPLGQLEDEQSRIEALRAEIVSEHRVKLQEVTEKLQAVHEAELVAIQQEREAEALRHQEEVGHVREEAETRFQQELEQLTLSHKMEVSHLQQQYQAQLDEMTTSHQKALAQVHDSVGAEIRSELVQKWEAKLGEIERQHHSQLEQLHNTHTAQLTMMEEEGAERLAVVGRELEQTKEQNSSLQTQLNNLKSELCEVQGVAEQQRTLLSQQEEERQRLGREVQQAGAREREREEKEDREHREDTASLAILHAQLSALTAEKSALQESLSMLQSSVAGCIQLAGLVDQTLSPPSTSSHPHHWHTPTAQLASEMESTGSHEDSKEGEGTEEGDTLTPPATNSPGSTVVTLTNISSAVSTKSLPSSTILGHTPSDDSGLASQQASVVNSEATVGITPLMDGLETTPVTSHSSPPHPPNLTILPLDTTTLSPDRSQAPPHGLSYDQSQVGMLSISFLDATQYPSVPHLSHPHPSHPHPPPLPRNVDLSVASLDHSLLPVSLSNLPALQEGLSHLHDAVTALLQHYISLSAEAADYQQKWISSTTQLKERISSERVLDARVSELENEVRLRGERLADTTQQMTAAHDNLQSVVREIEETKAEVERLKQQLISTQEALTASQQREGEVQTLLKSKTEDSESQKKLFESQQTASEQQVQMLETQTAQLQEELQAAQRNCASAIHEREALHEENKKLASVRVTLEGQLHALREESEARSREWERELKQKEDEIRELQAIQVALASHQDVQERLRTERDELQQRLENVEHQLALNQVVPVEEQMSRIQELTAREAQLSGELHEQVATCRALEEKVRVAQDSLNQTTQENLSVKMEQAQLEGEVRRLRGELQRRETALHRIEAQSASQGRELSVALQELSQLRGRLEEQRKEVEGESSESEADHPQDGSSNEVVLSLQKELQQQREVESSLQTQMGLLRDTLNSKDHELEALRMARSHQERALHQLKAQISTRREQTVEEDQQVDPSKGREDETMHEENSILHSASSSSVLEGDGPRSILVRLAELAPVLSQEAHTVSQLTKNIPFPALNVEQLSAAIDSLTQVVGALSVQSDGSDCGWRDVLVAVQRLVEELTVLVSSLDQGKNTQLPQQLSAVGELLSQLLTTDREALVQDTNTLRETIATLQAQLQYSVQTEQVDEENTQLRKKLEDAEALLQKSNEMNAQLRVSLDSEVSHTSRLQSEQQSSRDAVSQLEREVEGLQTLLTSVTSELEEARSRLTQYQQTEDSLERSAHTISSLHQELRSSKQREAELENSLQEVFLSQAELEKQHSNTQVQHTATLASIQEALTLERAMKDELCAQLTEVQSQLQQAVETQHARKAEEKCLRERLQERERELERARDLGRRADEGCGEKEAELGRVHACLQALETDNREQGEHYSQLLDNERRMVVSLRSSLQAKERELTEAMNKFLQEKVEATKAQGELAALRARLETAQQHITSLRNKVSSLHGESENRGGDDTIRQLELDQLKRQLHQLQTSSEEEVCELRSALGTKKEEVKRLQKQLTTLDTATFPSSLTDDVLKAKLTKLYAKYREAEVHRKALVFQKNYLKCQVDAFFQTQQTALIMMADMGATLAHTPQPKSSRRPLIKFKTVVHAVMATLRFRYVVRRKHQYIQSYSSRVEREKHGLVPHLRTGAQSVAGGRATVGIETSLSSRLPQQHWFTSTTGGATHHPHTNRHSTLPLNSAQLSSSTQHNPHFQASTWHTPPTTTNTGPQLLTYIPSLARLQAKLSGTVN